MSKYSYFKDAEPAKDQPWRQTKYSGFGPMSPAAALDLADQQLDALDGPQVQPKPETEYPLLSQAIGAGENLLTLLTGATSGTVGHIAGTVAGIPKAIIDGDFGTPEGVQTIRDAASQVGGALTYEPKTDAGKAIAGEVSDFYGEHLWPLEAAAGIAPVKAPINPRVAASSPSQIFRDVEVGIPRTPFKVNLDGIAERGVARSDLDGAGAAQATDAARRAAQAQELPIPFEGPAQLTRGQLNRDFEQIQFEREQAKVGATGQPLREREAAQAEVYGKNLDDMQETVSGGVRYGDDFEQGSVVAAKVQQKKDADWADVGEAYNVARAQGEMDVPVISQQLPRAFEELNSIRHLSPEVDQLLATADDLGLRQNGQFNPTASVDAYVKLREVISQAVPNTRQGKLIASKLKEAIDSDMQAVESGPLFKQAQAKAQKFYETYDDNPLMDKVTEGPAEKIFKSIKAGDNNRVTALRDNMMQTEAGAQQWRGIQGRFLKDLADRTLNPNVRDINGNPGVKPAELHKWITELEQSGKMDIIFDKKTQEMLYTLRDVAQDLFTTPPGSVNYSNTSSALANAMKVITDLGLTAGTGLPLPLTMGGSALMNRRAAKKLDRKINSALYPQGNNQ